MALNLAQPFKRAGAFAIDETLVLTKAEMKAINDNVMPSNYLAVCKEDGQLYLYNKENDVDEETGKYRILQNGGGDSDKFFEFSQTTPSAQWEIQHQLNKFPSVTIVDSAGSVVVGDIEYIDNNNVVITFQSAFSGKAYIN